MQKYNVVSADSHVDIWALPQDLFTSRVSKQWQSKVPRVVDSPEGPTWIAGADGEFKLGLAGQMRSAAGRIQRMFSLGWKPEERRPAVPELRLEDLDRDRLDAEVIYGAITLGELVKDYDVAAASFRAYNGWAAEFSNSNPDRFYPLGLLPANDVETAVEDLDRIARLGLRGAQWHFTVNSRPIWDSYWDPLWAAASESGIVISLHAPVRGGTTMVKEVPGADPHPSSAAWFCVIPLQLDEAITSVIFSGMLERHPGLRVVITESGTGWIPFLLDRMDDKWIDHYEAARWKELIETKPSDLFRRQMFCTFQKETIGPRLASEYCPDNFMWGSDYPHRDGLWPDSHENIEESMAGIDPALRRKIVNDNARQLYRMDAS